MGRAPDPDAYVAERLDHLGIVAGVCREIGLAEWLDAQDVQRHERVGVGTATMAMLLNGLGFSNRRLYLAPQLFATKAVDRLVGGARDHGRGPQRRRLRSGVGLVVRA